MSDSDIHNGTATSIDLQNKLETVSDAALEIPTTEMQTSDAITPKAPRQILCPVPACCTTPKCLRFWTAMKYLYVIGTIVIGLAISGLSRFDPLDTWLDEAQTATWSFFLDNSVWWVLFLLFAVTLLKAFGMKDILGLRVISVALLSNRITDSHQFTTLIVCMLIIGVLSSISKLIEYKVIGYELQVVQGTPVEYIFKYLRKLLLCECCCCHQKSASSSEVSQCRIKDAQSIKWVDSRWTFEISAVSRTNPDMNIIANFDDILSDVLERRSKGTRFQEQCSPPSGCCWRVCLFILASLWASTVEWIQPVTELFLYAHNWDFSLRNAAVIVMSEVFDFDKAYEAWLIIGALMKEGERDVVTAKIESLLAKPVFWALGYLVVLPPTLLWGYKFHKKHIRTRENYEQAIRQPSLLHMGRKESMRQLSEAHAGRRVSGSVVSKELRVSVVNEKGIEVMETVKDNTPELKVEMDVDAGAGAMGMKTPKSAGERGVYE